MLVAEHYHEAWKKSLVIVWRLIELSTAAQAPGPDVIVIHGYSLYVLLAQVIILETFLEECNHRYNITEVRIESPETLEHETELYYGVQIYTRYFHDVAKHWALRKHIDHSEIYPALTGKSRSYQFPTVAGRVAASWKEGQALRARIRRQFRRLVLGPIKTASSLPSILRGERNLVFYFPSTGAGLDLWSPSYAIDAGLVVGIFSLRDRLWRRAASDRHQRPDFRVLFNRIDSEVLNELVSKRFREHLDQVYGEGLSVFRLFSSLISVLRNRGFNVAYVSSAPFVELHGYLAEAFRQAGSKIGAVQHGGSWANQLSTFGKALVSVA